MSYQLLPLTDDVVFEKLVRDILRREYDDHTIECFGRNGQGQHGIDGLSATPSGITFQAKLKDIRYKTDEALRKVLITEMRQEHGLTSDLNIGISHFVFASTFKNDTPSNFQQVKLQWSIGAGIAFQKSYKNIIC